MAEFKVIEGGATKAKVGPAVRGALLLLVLETLGGFVFGSVWVVFAAPTVAAILDGAQLPNLGMAIAQLLNVNVLPLVLALLAVLTPLFGWWIYSRVPAENQNSTGWSMAAIFTTGHILIGALRTFPAAGLQDAVFWIGYVFGLAFAFAVILLWVMLFMGVGFLIAKLFKSKL